MSSAPTSAGVLDLETRSAEGLAVTLNLQEIMNKIENAGHTEELQEIAAEHEIKIQNLKNFDPIKRKVKEHFTKMISGAALKLYGSEIYCIGWAGLSGGAVKCGVVTEEKSEKQVIGDFLSFLSDKGPFLIVGFNVRGFDIPRLRYRCMIHDLAWPDWMPSTIHEDRYEKQCIFDLRDVLDEGRLDTHLRVFGLPPKTASGAHVQDMTPEEVASYCADDVERERRLALRIMPNTSYRHFVV